MIKYIAALMLAVTPVAANAQIISIDIDRMNVINEASKTICRVAILSPGKASEALDRHSAYLSLTKEERFYLISLCVLYAQGRLDGSMR